jgi:hypothetical protein
MRAFSRLSRFGMTFKPLTEDLGAALLTWYREAFLAKTSAAPERERASQGNAAECGSTWRGSLAKYDRDTRLWRTAQYSLLGDLERFSGTWPRWGTMRNGECSERFMPEHLTKESGYGLWRTPTAHDWKNTGNCSQLYLSDQVRPRQIKNPKKPDATPPMWPTPRAGTPGSRVNGKGGKILEEEVKIAEGLRERGKYAAKSGGALNPEWVEWLMGWPLGWTGFRPLAMVKSHRWPHLHGRSCTKG